jgi:hypothetical protein
MAYKKKDDETEVSEMPVEGATMVTWLGEDDQHEDGHGPMVNTWRGIAFTKGKPVPITDPMMIEKAKANRFYKVG